MNSSLTYIKYTFLGLILLGVSAVTSAFLSKNESRKVFNGKIQHTNTPTVSDQKSCRPLVSGTPDCTFTASNGPNSSTTTAGKLTMSRTSDLTLFGTLKIKSDTGGGKHSSQSPV